MSTITSPRTITPASSRRQSSETITRSQTSSPSQPPTHGNGPPPQLPQQQKRNRAALRDYYGLKSPPASSPIRSGVQEELLEDGGAVKESEFDAAGFVAERYVQELLESKPLTEVLKVEGRLINELRALDGERKALVYDNYSKLIAATDTIRKMRSSMDPLGPTTSTLSSAIAHIAETASAVASDSKAASSQFQDETSPAEQKTLSDSEAEEVKKEKQREIVRWVLAAPRRLQTMLRDGHREEAQAEWNEVLRVLERWNGVDGVDEVRKQGEAVLRS